MENTDLKRQKIVASLIHSRVVLEKAPQYVIDALTQWLNALDRITTENVTAFSDKVNVNDAANLSLEEVKRH